MSSRIIARTGVVVASACLFAAAACAPGDAPEASGAAESSTSTSVVTTSADGQMTVDMDAIFPAGEGRDLLLNNCQSCHTWVPVVVLQMAEDEWARWRQDHRARVPGLSDAEFETLYAYLVENFNPDRPVPELPPVLLESWTTY